MISDKKIDLKPPHNKENEREKKMMKDDFTLFLFSF